ncbi:MAG: hypothetical protein FWG21_07310 [Oscillospiraceae bacterium]|nr:hypothetical protein [Oscillospiraceae bacterium]
MEICEAVISKGKDGDRIVFKDILAVIVVSVLHRSAYEKIGAVYADAVSWVEQNGYEIIENNQKTTSMAYRIRKAWTIG